MRLAGRKSIYEDKITSLPETMRVNNEIWLPAVKYVVKYTDLKRIIYLGCQQIYIIETLNKGV